jgi:hypothetical protein
MVFCRIRGDAIQPRVKGAIAAKPRQSAIGLDKRLLRHVLHLVRVADVAGHEAHDLLLVLQHQEVKSTSIALFCASHKLLVGDRCGQASHSSMMYGARAAGPTPPMDPGTAAEFP